MSTLTVTITSPPPNSVVPSRTFTVRGTVSLHATSGRSLVGSISVGVRFGVNGPTVAARVVSNSTWECTGAPPAGIHPNSAITVVAVASATLRFFIPADRSFDVEDITGSASLPVQLPGPVAPVITVDAINSPVLSAELPKMMTFTGTAVGLQAPMMLVQYAVEGSTGGFPSAVSTSGNFATWSVTLPVPPGDHTLMFKGIDRFGSGQDVTSSFTLKPDPPITIPPGAKAATLSGAPTTSSITSWTRLEPHCTGADMGTSSSARLFDPLWLMTRQWQMGEFQAEDTGTPVQARVRATNATLTRCFTGELPRPKSPNPTTVSASSYDPKLTPLEVIVERRQMRPADADDARMLAFAVEAGLHFLRILESQPLSRSYRNEFIRKLALQELSDATSATADDATVNYLQSMVGRAPDGRTLAAILRTSGAAQLAQDPALHIAQGDRAEVKTAAETWLTWYDALYSEPRNATDDAWNPSRLEYAMAVSTRLSAAPQDDITFCANEIDGSLLDWSSFDVHALARLGADGAPSAASLVEATVPAPISFPGAPSPRFWEMEDAKIAYGLVPVGPTDLAHLLMIEYASTYGNDWFAIPLQLPVGSVTRVDSLVVTDTFGVRSLVRPIGDPALPAPFFSMWQSEYLYPPPGSEARIATNQFFLPPTLARSMDSAPLEDVLFTRDETANLAWAIERTVESPIERPAQRYLAADANPVDAGVDAAPFELPRYRLSSSVPPNWIPFIPVQQQNPEAPNDPNQIISRLQKGAVLQPDGSKKVHTAVAEVLNVSANLLLYDEEVPREGARLTRQRRLARWTDGSTWLWTSFRNQVGQGEGSSHLQFDQILER